MSLQDTSAPPEAVAARRGRDRPLVDFARVGPLLLVGIAVGFGIVVLRGEANPVPYLNDSGVHAEMVRTALARYRAGHFPLNEWWPYLGLGSPQFLHYQSLGAMLTAALGLVLGADRAFSLVTYLLLVLWPVCVYVSARILRWGPWPSAIAAMVSPLLFSAIGIGYEQQSYVWLGYGLWSQLFAMWTLPLAWACTFRAVGEGRYRFWAVLAIAATISFHYFTGYLAVLALVVFPFLAPGEIKRRLGRAAVVGLAALLVADWVVVPVYRLGRWTSVNEFLQHTANADSYGARRVLSWLVEGQLFDSGRLPVVTILVALGLLTCVRRFRYDERARALVVLFVVNLVLFFGRPTLGPLVDLLPGSRDLFLRRFLMGVQLSGILLAGVGAVAAFQFVLRSRRRWPDARARRRATPSLSWLLVALLAILVLAPGWLQVANYDANDATAISDQLDSDVFLAPDLDAVVSQIRSGPPGRVYAGLPTNWGMQFTIGQVPVFKYLAAEDVPEVGYTLRTASLMTDPEANFDESNPGDYSLFGVHYLILPSNQSPPVRATYVMSSGPLALWTVGSGGYLQVVDTTTPISLNRTDVGAQTLSLLTSRLPEEGIYPTVAYDGLPAAPPTLPGGVQDGQPGRVLSESDDLVDGQVSGTVTADRTAVVLLKVTFDPNWVVTVDGYPATTEMLAPALVGVEVSPGTHTVRFTYVGYSRYPELFAVSIVTLLVLAFSARLRPLAQTLGTRLRRRRNAG